jgi:hypothetical protein
MPWLLLEQPCMQLISDRSCAEASKMQVLPGAGELLLLGIVLDAIEPEDQIDRLLRVYACSFSAMCVSRG